MSSTIGSPAWMTRSDASWWGDAEFGPEPTIAKCASSWPSAIESLADLRGRRPPRSGRRGARPRSGRRPGPRRCAASRSSAISSASLTMRSSRRTPEASRVLDAAPERRLEAQDVHRQHRVGHRDAAAPGSCPAVARAYGSSVSSQVAIASRRPQPGLGGTTLQPRHDDDTDRAGARRRAASAARAASPRSRSGSAGPSRPR